MWAPLQGTQRTQLASQVYERGTTRTRLGFILEDKVPREHLALLYGLFSWNYIHFFSLDFSGASTNSCRGTVLGVFRPENSSHSPECTWGVAAPTWSPRPGPLPGARGAHSQPNLWPCSRAWGPLFSWFLPAGGRARRRQKIFGGFSPPQASSAVDRDILGSRAYVFLTPF